MRQAQYLTADTSNNRSIANSEYGRSVSVREGLSVEGGSAEGGRGARGRACWGGLLEVSEKVGFGGDFSEDRGGEG